MLVLEKVVDPTRAARANHTCTEALYSAMLRQVSLLGETGALPWLHCTQDALFQDSKDESEYHRRASGTAESTHIVWAATFIRRSKGVRQSYVTSL